MPRINRISHVVLHVSDFDACVAFYRDVLGMEVVNYRKERGRAFLSFGAQHHDIGIFEDHGEKTRGTLGLVHVAFQLDGGLEELKAMYERVRAHGVTLDHTSDHGVTQSFYFHDPDGNLLEICVDTFADPAEGLQYMREQGGGGKRLELNEVTTA